MSDGYTIYLDSPYARPRTFTEYIIAVQYATALHRYTGKAVEIRQGERVVWTERDAQ